MKGLRSSGDSGQSTSHLGHLNLNHRATTIIGQTGHTAGQIAHGPAGTPHAGDSDLIDSADDQLKTQGTKTAKAASRSVKGTTKTVRLRNISCCGDAESAAPHIRQRIQTASDLSIRRVVVRRIVGGEGPGDLPEQVRWRYLACDREIVERRKRGEVVSVLDVRQALLADPADAKPRALGLRDEVLSRRLYIQQLAAMSLDDRAHAPQRGIIRVLFPYRHATHHTTKSNQGSKTPPRFHCGIP